MGDFYQNIMSKLKVGRLSGTESNLIRQAIINEKDSTPLKLVLNLATKVCSGSISIYDIVHNPKDFNALLRFNCEEVTNFIKVCNKETFWTIEIDSMHFPIQTDILCFTHSTTLLSLEDLQTKLEKTIKREVELG